MYFSLVALVLAKALLTEVCDALNVTVDPGPVATVTESNNLTLSCLVSQRKRTSGVLVLRWFFSPPGAAPPSSSSPSPPPPPPPPPSPQPPPSTAEVLIVRMGIKKMKQYGNYTRRFPRPKFLLQEEQAGEVFRLLILNVTAEDRGVYTCRVQEIRRHRNTWRASSNGTGSTTLAVSVTLEEGSRDGLLRLVSDLYLCAVLICCLGLLSIFLFTLVLGCQHLLRRNRRLKASYLLVKCPESSSGETVTDSTCSSSSSPRTQRKEPVRPPHGRARPKATAQMPPKAEDPPLPPPHMLMKGPVAQQRPRKPRRLKNQTRRANPQRDYQEDSLTYAELELVRPRPEPPVSTPAGPAEAPAPAPTTSSTTSTIITTMDTNTDTVYAQILFQEKQL